MKYLFLALAGAADVPLTALGGRTPLEVARTPTLDRLATRGQVGTVFPLGENATFSAGAVSTALVGFDPDRYYQGPGPLEAVAAGVLLAPRDLCFCVTFVTTDGEAVLGTSPSITPSEMRQLTDRLQERLNSASFDFYAGVGTRAILRWRGGERDMATVPPTRLATGPLRPQLPQGDGAQQLQSLIFDGLEILEAHPINHKRRDEGKPPLNLFWPWGQGEAVALPSLVDRTGHSGAMLTDNASLRGLALASGMTLVDNRAPSDRGDFVTDAPALLAALDAGADLAFFHTLAPARATQTGDAERKIHVLEQIDRQVVGPLMDGLQKRGESFRLIATPVHVTLTETGAHTADPIPFLRYDSTQETRNILPWQERVLPDTRVSITESYRLLDRLRK